MLVPLLVLCVHVVFHFILLLENRDNFESDVSRSKRRKLQLGRRGHVTTPSKFLKSNNDLLGSLFLAVRFRFFLCRIFFGILHLF